MSQSATFNTLTVNNAHFNGGMTTTGTHVVTGTADINILNVSGQTTLSNLNTTGTADINILNVSGGGEMTVSNLNTTGTLNGMHTFVDPDLGDTIFDAFPLSSNVLNGESGGQNTSFGNFNLENLETGGGNTAFGVGCLQQVTTGEFNTAVGQSALTSGTGLTYCTAIGKNAGANAPNDATNITCLGYASYLPTNALIDGYDLNGTLVSSFIEEDDLPISVFTDVSGNVYVNQAGAKTITKYNPLTGSNLATYHSVTSIVGGIGGIFIDPVDSNIYAVGASSALVYKINPATDTIETIIGNPDSYEYSYGILVDADHIYVGYALSGPSGHGAVVKYNKTSPYAVVDTLAGTSTLDGPSQLAFTNTSNIVVSMYNNNNVIIVDKNFNTVVPVFSVGGGGYITTQICDDSGYVYIVDGAGDLYKYTTAGTLVEQLPKPRGSTIVGEIAYFGGKLYVANASGLGTGTSNVVVLGNQRQTDTFLNGELHLGGSKVVDSNLFIYVNNVEYKIQLLPTS